MSFLLAKSLLVRQSRETHIIRQVLQCDRRQLTRTINRTIINMDKISRKIMAAIYLLRTNSLRIISKSIRFHSSRVCHRTILLISKPINCSITDNQVCNMSHLVCRCSNHYNNNNNSNNNSNSSSCNNSYNKLMDHNPNLFIGEPSATVKQAIQ